MPAPRQCGATATERTPAARKWHVYQIDVKVRWGDTRAVQVVTLRTLAEQPEGGLPRTRTTPGGLPPTRTTR